MNSNEQTIAQELFIQLWAKLDKIDAAFHKGLMTAEEAHTSMREVYQEINKLGNLS